MPRTLLTALRGLWRSRPRGAAIIEFALVLPFLLLLLVGLCDFGFAAYDWLQVQAAAEAGAQYAVRHTWDQTAVAAAVTGATGTGGISAAPAPFQVCACTDSNNFRTAGPPTNGSCATASPPCTSGFGVYASVSAQLNLSPMLPYPGLPATLTLTGQAYRRIN